MDKIRFEIIWYNGGPAYAPNVVVGRDYVMRHDLSDAITTACNMLKGNKGEHAPVAHGFYVQRARD